MTTLPFGSDISLSAAAPQVVGVTPTIVGVIGLAGAGASGATTTQLHLVHTKAEMLTLVGSNGELNAWAEEFYSRDMGNVLVGIIAAHDATSDTARDAAANAALDLFEADIGEGMHASIIDIHAYGANVESGSEQGASGIVAHLEQICEARRSVGFANYGAAADSALSAWATEVTAWAGANRKPRVMCCAGNVVTAANPAASGGIAASTVLVALRAALDGGAGIAMPLGNKSVTGVVSTYPVIPYVLNRNASVVGRTLQNTAGVSFVANYRGWKSVRAELAAAIGSNRRYESVLRAVDIVEDRYEAAVGLHLDNPNRTVEQAALLQTLSDVTAQLVIDNIIADAGFQIGVTLTENTLYRVTLTGTVTTIKPLVQVDIFIEVE